MRSPSYACKALFLFYDMEYTLLLQKAKRNSPTLDSLEDFGMVCTDTPFMPYGETKKLPQRDWADEDGEDTYIPDNMPLSAFDWEIGMGYKGDLSSAQDALKKFTDYLTGKDENGSELKVYSQFTGIGRQGIYFKGMGGFDFSKTNTEEVVTFKLKLRVTDPVTDVLLTKE